jgi:hypothetical protein
MQQVSKVCNTFFYEKENLPFRRVKKDTLVTSCIQKFLAPVSLDNNFFDTQNLKIFSCVNPWTFKTLVLLAF